MSRARGEKEYLGVLKGLNTEANALAFPEGYSSDEQNFLLAKDGTIRVRRKGLENTSDDQSYTSGSGNPVLIRSYYWEKPDVVLAVVSTLQHEVMLRIHRNDSDFTYIDEYQISSNAGSGFDASFSPILNGISITGGGIFGREAKPILLDFDEDTDSINIYSLDLYFRDFDLIEDGTELTDRPNELSDEHTYNLYNAGWRSERRVAPLNEDFRRPLIDFTTVRTTWEQPIMSFQSPNRMTFENDTSKELKVGQFFTISTSKSNDGTYEVESVVNKAGGSIDYVTTVERTIVNEAIQNLRSLEVEYDEFPSNADIVYLGLKSDTDGREVFSRATLYETSVGTTEAPRGHYIYSLFGTRDREDILFYPDEVNIPTSTLTLQDTISI